MFTQQNPPVGYTNPISDVEVVKYKKRGKRIIVTNIIIFFLYNALILIKRMPFQNDSVPVAPTGEQAMNQMNERLQNSSDLQLYFYSITDQFKGIEGWEIWNKHMLILGVLAVLFFIIDAIRRKKSGGRLYIYALIVVFVLGVLSAMVGFMETSF